MAPLVSIVIPCYNAEKYVAEAIASALAQTYSDCEIVIVDDGSTDGSLEVIKGFGDRVHCETGPNRGACAARNLGFSLANGKYIKFLDADDCLLRGAIARQVSIMEGLPANAGCYGSSLDHETSELVFDKVRLTAETPVEEALAACYENDILISCPLHRREMLEREGVFFDTKLGRGQEWNFHIRILLAGGVFVYHDEPVFLYRQHDGAERISNLTGVDRLDIEIRKNRLTNQLIESKWGGDFPGRVKNSVYVRAYGLARQFSRAGRRRKAEELFQFCDALECGALDDKAHEIGSFWYHALRKFIPPYQLEQLIHPVRRLRGRN